MIVSHEHRFIFIKTRKTAGTSLEISLSRYLGPTDICTPISAEDEAVRRELGRGPQNFRGPIWRHRPRDLGRWLRRGHASLYYNHMPASRVRGLLGPRTWDDYTTFCFERNPWDKVVSAYYWDHRRDTAAGREPGTPFSDYLKGRRGLDVRDYPLYTIRGQVAVDRVGRFENLAEDLRQICLQIGIDFDGWLPGAKGGFRPRDREYRDLYTTADRELVARRFRREIDLFGYVF